LSHFRALFHPKSMTNFLTKKHDIPFSQCVPPNILGDMHPFRNPHGELIPVTRE
jgi:hypothetical protein